jgi:hypothetical protein
MNLNEFLEVLKKTKNKYNWNKNSRLLRAEYKNNCRHCPITAVCEEVTGLSYALTGLYYASYAVDKARKALNLKEDLCAEIIYAADGANNELREQLIEALS